MRYWLLWKWSGEGTEKANEEAPEGQERDRLDEVVLRLKAVVLGTYFEDSNGKGRGNNNNKKSCLLRGNAWVGRGLRGDLCACAAAGSGSGLELGRGVGLHNEEAWVFSRCPLPAPGSGGTLVLPRAGATLIEGHPGPGGRGPPPRGVLFSRSGSGCPSSGTLPSGTVAHGGLDRLTWREKVDKSYFQEKMTFNSFEGSRTCVPADTNKDEEFVEEFTRLKTFATFPSSSPVSASTLARAGFLYTGEGDTVQCFSCHATVDRWQYGDSAVGRHRKISPNCRFINGFYFENSATQSTNPGIQNGQYKAENYVGNRSHFALDRPSETHADYLLRTGQVVDISDTIYPRNPAMCSEEARLKTFQNWPDYAHLTPRELASAGLYYTGIDDQVQCFCCGGKLKNWEPCDRAWSEHRRHFPNCFFVLGRNGNVRSESDVSSDRNFPNSTNSPRNPAMAEYEARIITFGTWIYSVNKEQLARAGFYALGEGDKVKCFHCGGGLTDWKPSEDPWEQHAKWYPGCKYLLDEKGQEYINNIHLTHSLGESLVRTAEKTTSLTTKIDDTIFQNPMVQEAIRMGFSFRDIKKTMEEKIQTSGSSYLSLEVLIADLVSAQKDNTQDESSQTSLQKDISTEEQLRRLQEEKLCKICMDKNIAVVFVPCGHLVTCKQCAEAVDKCPMCYTIITFKQKIFMS